MKETYVKILQKFQFTLLFLFLVTSIIAKPFNKEDGYLVLMHPTIGNVIWLESLIELDVIDLEEYQILGVYHTNASYDYQKTEKYIRKNKLKHIDLLGVDCDIDFSTLPQNKALKQQVAAVADHAYGFIFNGGPDIPAKFYNAPQSTLTVVTDPYRHLLEIGTLTQLLGSSTFPEITPLMDAYETMPIIGLCLGAQTINVATGGTLVQDIPLEIYGTSTVEDVIEMSREHHHKNYAVNSNKGLDLFYSSMHPIKLQEANIWEGVDTSSMPDVISAHHQSIKKLGKEMRPIAASTDGKVIEAIESSKYPCVVGLQFHPERVYIYEPSEYNYTSEEKIRPHDEMKAGGSLDFHHAIWANYSLWVKQFRAQNQ